MTDDSVKQKTQNFFSRFPIQQYTKGKILADPESLKNQIFFLEKGHVQQYAITEDGEEVVVNIYKPGAFFPMAQVIHTYINVHFFKAIDSVSIRVAPFATVLTFVKREPDVLFDLLQRVYTGIDGLLSHVETLMAGSAMKRLLVTLHILAKRFGGSKEYDVHITFSLTHHDLAALTGLTRETVSRLMSKLKKEGLITYTNATITIRSMEELEKKLV